MLFVSRHHSFCPSQTSPPLRGVGVCCEARPHLSRALTFLVDSDLLRWCPARKLKEKDELAKDKWAGTLCSDRHLVRFLSPSSTLSLRPPGGLVMACCLTRHHHLGKTNPFFSDLANSQESVITYKTVCIRVVGSVDTSSRSLSSKLNFNPNGELFFLKRGGNPSFNKNLFYDESLPKYTYIRPRLDNIRYDTWYLCWRNSCQMRSSKDFSPKLSR